jgi:DNA-binding SARP family transcriptional activator
LTPACGHLAAVSWRPGDGVVDHPPVLAVQVLGPVEVHRDGVPLDLGGPQQRAVIAHLAIDAGRVVSVERLIDRLWGETPPRTPLGTLQSYVSRLRRAIEPAREAGDAPQVLVSEAPGYVLRVPPEQIDVHRFGALVAEARTAAAHGDHTTALAGFDCALALWRGPALAGVGPDDEVRPIVVRLEDERAAAVEDRFDALLALGRHTEAVPALQAAVDEHPMRERLWAQLALALYRCSRQADALRALSAARTTLLDELGLDPGPELRELESRILAQDPVLLAPAVTVAPQAVVTVDIDVPRVELVGRDAEWRALTAALTSAASSGAQLVLVEGEPGIGKSTVCDAFLAHAGASGWRTAIGRCVEPGLAPSLWPAAEVVRTLIDQAGSSTLVDDLPLYRFVTDNTLAGGPSSSVELADQFVDLLDRLAPGPLVVLLDDLHWADRATLDVTTLTLERLGARPIVLLAAFRPPELVPGSLLGDALGRLVRAVPSTRVSMTPLASDDVARLMEITTGAAPTPEIAARVRERAGGNPLFVTELARLAGERGLAADDEVPAAIRDVVRSRLAQLPERATAELQVAAVLGERFELRTVMAASERDPDACLDALDAAIVTRILVPSGDGFRFAHALVRDAVLAEVTSLRLARLHQRAADALVTLYGDGADVAEPVAFHRLAGTAVADPVVVARAAIRASDVARWRNALDTAELLAEKAIEVLAGVVRTAEVQALEVEALEAIVSVEYRREGDANFERLAERVEQFAERARSDSAASLALFLRWGAVDETRDLSTVAASTARARAIAERAVDRYAIVTSRYMLCSYATLLGHLDEAAEHLAIALDAVGVPDPDRRPDHVPLVLLPVVAGILEALRGDADAAREHAHRRTPAWLSQRVEVDPSATGTLAFNSAFVESLLGNPQEVLRFAPEGHHGGPSLFSHQEAASKVLETWARAQLGDASSIESLLPAVEVVDSSGDRTLTGALLAFAGDALLAVGDASAADVLTRARAESESRGEVWWLAEILRLLAACDRRFGDGAHAEALIADALRIATDQGAHLLRDRVASEQGHPVYDVG